RIVVAGEMLELGPATEELHRRCGQHAAEHKIDVVIGVRGAAKYIVEAARLAGGTKQGGGAIRAEFVETPELAGEWLAREYRSSDLDGRFLVVAATQDRRVNAEVSRDAEARNLPCNVADDPELCSFILPAIHRSGPIAVGVTTGGASPALAQRIRDELAERYGEEHAQLARRLAALRPWAKQQLPSYEARREYFRRLVDEALA
ncbi:MAG: NAD(P)-dependent oxidoreductase, partial [Gaiellaceae bacterium]